MNRLNEWISIGFPLRGEWLAVNSPGTRIPSHGTNRLGTRYAYDFIQVNWDRKGWPSYRIPAFRYLTVGASLKDYYCWGKEIYAPCDGIITNAVDGLKERERTFLIKDIYAAAKNSKFDPRVDNIQNVAGNFIILKCDEHVYAGFVHLQTGSIQVSVGQRVKQGDVIGRIGHSGNSYGPHLHFQLMDSNDITVANGLPCAFEQYEIYKNGKWNDVFHGVPTDKERIRFRGSSS
jgi:hypothetical protein